MKRFLSPFAGALLLTTAAAAQGPPAAEVPRPNPVLVPPPSQAAPAPPAAPAAVESLTRFDPNSVETRFLDRRWQLWAGKVMLKDFGDRANDARAANHLIRNLRLTHKGTVGSPKPVMEYWLADGQAPQPAFGSRQVIPFDADELKAERVDGGWSVRDRHRTLYHFGPDEAGAKQALAVIRRYGFNQLGLIGAPEPSMTYLLHDPNPHPTVSAPSPQSALMERLSSASARSAWAVPGSGDLGSGTRTPFDPRRLDVRRAADGWVLTAGAEELVRLGPSEHDAREALRVARDFHFTEYCRLGSGSFGVFLSQGRPPGQVPLGARSVAIRPEALQARQTADGWVIDDGRQALWQFGDKPEEAKLALAAIRHYRFDHVVQVGGLRFPVRER